MRYRLLILLVSVCAAGAVPSVARDDLLKQGESLAAEDFGGGLGNWMAEGDVDARIENGRLRFEAAENTPEKKGNIWWRRRFSGPVKIEFDYQSATPYGLTMFWFNSHGRGGADLLSIKRNGRYDDYVKGPMNGYHVSFHRFDSGVSNLRKSYGFHVLSSKPDPVPMDNLEPHHVEVYCAAGRIRVLVDGILVHDVVDDGKLCTEGDAWLHDYPCQGTGEAFVGGYVGIRHTQKQVAYYDNFKVYRLVEP